MRTWLLLALIGLVLVYAFSVREGVDSTLTPEPACPSGSTLYNDGRCIKLTGVSPDSDNKCRSGIDSDGWFDGPLTFSDEFKQFDGKCIKFVNKTCPSGYLVYGDMSGVKCVPVQNMSPNSSVGGNGAITSTPQPSCAPQSTFDGVNCLDSNNRVSPPTCPSEYHYLNGKCVANTPAGTSSSTSYADILSGIQDSNNGALPPPVDEHVAPIDVSASRSQTGPVFDSSGVFSGQSGIGQGTAASAALGLSGGNKYGTGSGNYDLTGNKPQSGRELSFGTKQAPNTNENNLPVMGPNWGGMGVLSSSSTARSSQPAPTLYGPIGGKPKQVDQKNSTSTLGIPSFASAGSDWSNMFAVTSRAPGDQDLIPNPYLQSTSYSLANGSQKTDPVPFLTDFSAFQS